MYSHPLIANRTAIVLTLWCIQNNGTIQTNDISLEEVSLSDKTLLQFKYTVAFTMSTNDTKKQNTATGGLLCTQTDDGWKIKNMGVPSYSDTDGLLL